MKQARTSRSGIEASALEHRKVVEHDRGGERRGGS